MDYLLELFFPKRCVGCNKFGAFLCKNCISNIFQSDLVCPKCERLAIGGVTHPVCKRKFGLDGLWSLGIYQDPLRLAIRKIKYRYVKKLARVLIDLLIYYWAKNQPFLFSEIKKSRGESWLITPVPLHKKRENWRGFNQSALLGKDLAERLGLNYEEVLLRTKNTRPQASLKSQDRKHNIKNAFALKPNCKLSTVNCLLIDDVWTTGSTLKECCYILKKNGAKKVWALTLAR